MRDYVPACSGMRLQVYLRACLTNDMMTQERISATFMQDAPRTNTGLMHATNVGAPTGAKVQDSMAVPDLSRGPWPRMRERLSCSRSVRGFIKVSCSTLRLPFNVMVSSIDLGVGKHAWLWE